jgi:two-component system sensor histidine kinase VicK
MHPSAILFSIAKRSNLLFFSYDITAGHFSYLNAAFKNFFSIDGLNFKSDIIVQIVHREDREFLRAQYHLCVDGKLNKSVECRFVRAGNEKTLRIFAYLQNHNGKQYISGHAEDITVYKEQSNTLNKHNNKKNTILNILTHDLAGPIGTIGNFSDMLRKEIAPFKSAEAENYIQTIKRISKSCIHLIRDFLNQEFLESAGVKLMKRRVELVERIKNVIDEYVKMQKNLGIQFFCKVNKDIIYVDIDEDKFLQVINNLISNSLKFTPDGGTIGINIDEGDRSVLVSVSDTGIGIPQKYHATIFDKFSDARRSGLHGEHSIGLGMSIIKTIIEWHGGKIWFRSEENKGTTFYIELPK